MSRIYGLEEFTMTEKRRVQVGDKLFAKFSRYIRPVTVTKVGRKYFYIDPWESRHQELRFSLSDWSPHDDNQLTTELYESEEAYKAKKADSKKRSVLSVAIRRHFDYVTGRWIGTPTKDLEAAAKTLGIEVDYDSES